MKDQFKEGRALYDVHTEAKYARMAKVKAKWDKQFSGTGYAQIDPEDHRFMLYVETVPKPDRFNHLSREQKRHWQRMAKEFLKALKEQS